MSITPLMARLLMNRGITTPDDGRDFFSPKLSNLHDPLLLDGVDQAAKRIAQAVSDGEKIVIYGYYDVDGMTAVAILDACLRLVNSEVDYYIPHRLDDGYGLNIEAVEKIASTGANLLISVDCGITAVDAVARAKQMGMDVIITDHHSPGETLPDAVAIVHPALDGQEYPNSNLCGAGVSFKLAWQVSREICGSKKVDDKMRQFLMNATTLAALGTIADVVPLIGENRSLACHGLRGLAMTTHRGLSALLVASGVADRQLDSFDVGFKLAPRLNACGRMGHATEAVELLMNPPDARAKEIASYLTKQNTQRQAVEREVTAQAVEKIEAEDLGSDDHKIIVVAGEGWHGGVVGIVASRLVDKYSKPARVISLNGDDVARGSARSMPGFNLGEALSACSEHLITCGGHAMAGGLSLRPGNLPAFTEAIGSHASQALAAAPIQAGLDIDSEATFAELGYPTVEKIEKMAPFGQGNPQPILAIRGVRIINPPKRMGRTGNTIGMYLGQNDTSLRAVGFSMGDLADMLVGVNEIDIAAQPGLNHYNGRSSVELKLVDVAW